MVKGKTVATIIAVRLKSTRLPKKALKKIGKLSSIELCVKNALKFQHIDHTIIATSTLKQDAELEKYTYREDVVFHQGHPEDVVQRYLDVVRKFNIDVIIRVTGDMPFISDEILQVLLDKHLKEEADYTVANEAAVGTNLEIISSEALERVKEYFPSANYSEYMTWYFQNNPNYFNLNFVDLPSNLIRNYRLTLDHSEDLEMFNIINNNLSIKNPNYSIKDIFKFLDAYPKIAGINKHITLKYKTDKELIATLNKVTKICDN